MSNINIGIACSDNAEPVSLLLVTLNELLPQATVKVLISGRAGSEALTMARYRGIYAIFVPRSVYHANIDGYEKRLVEIFKENEVNTVILADYVWRQGEVLKQAFPERVFHFNPNEQQEIIHSILS